jgi:hypothetical protein
MPYLGIPKMPCQILIGGGKFFLNLVSVITLWFTGKAAVLE